MHDTVQRLSAGSDQMTNVVTRALARKGGLTVANMRGPGFELLEQALAAENFGGDGLRALAPLPENAQKIIDDTVIEVGLDRLTFVADLLALGLTYNLTDPLSVTQLEWNASNKVGAAQRTMSPEARGENKLPDLLPNRLPIYLTTDNFSLGIRELRMSRRVGQPLDTNLIGQTTRSVNEAIEDASLNGATTIDGQELQVAGYKAPGLLNAPNAATQSLTAAAWSTVPVGATVFSQVQAMIAKLVANKKYGPYHLYVSTSVNAALDSDYDTVSASRGMTIRERILKIPQVAAIRSADLMPDGNATTHVGAKVALVQMTKDVVDIVVGQKPTVVPWTSLSGFTFYNLVMAIMVPRVRWDYNNKSGICIGTLA